MANSRRKREFFSISIWIFILMCPDNALTNPKTYKPDKIIEILQSLVMKVFLEIESGKGRWSLIKEAGTYTPGMALIWNLIGLQLKTAIANNTGDTVFNQLAGYIDTLKSDPQLPAQLTSSEYQQWEPAIKYLQDLKDICETHDFSIVRVYQQ